MSIQLWDRQEDEPMRWYERFERFRLAGPQRSLLGTYKGEGAEKGREGQNQKTPRTWNEAAEQWQWRVRAEAWDMAELERRRDDEEARYRESLDRHRDNALKLSQVALANAVRVLQATDKRLASLNPDDITPAMIPALMRAAAAVAEAALNGEAQALTVDQLVRALHGESDSA